MFYDERSKQKKVKTISPELINAIVTLIKGIEKNCIVTI